MNLARVGGFHNQGAQSVISLVVDTAWGAVARFIHYIL